MQCPRCGWQNPLDITACQRCGLAVQQAPPPATTDPQGPRPHVGGYGQGGYSQSGYPGGYGGAPGAGYPPPASYQPYGQPQPRPAAPAPYGLPYGNPAGSPYATGPVQPHDQTSRWQAAARPQAPAGTGRLARFLLLVAALASLGYAVWAMTARRAIFVDFVDNRAVSLGHARSSDRTDTVLLIVAGALAVVALAFWLIRLIGGRSRSGSLTLVGFVVSGLGLACIVVGLVLSGLVGSNGNRVDEGRRAVTATIVTGSGFIALAVGLVIGLVVVNARQREDRGRPEGTTTATPGW